MSKYYPSSNSWEDKGTYQVKHRFEDGVCTDILYARAGLTAREADDANSSPEPTSADVDAGSFDLFDPSTW